MLGCKRQEEQWLCRRGARDERHRGPLSRRRATTMGPCRWRWALVGAKEQQATSDQATGNQATSNRRGQGMARQGRVEQGRAGHVEPGMATSRAGPPGRASARATRAHLQCGQVCARLCARPWAGQGRAEQSKAGQSRVEQGRAGQGCSQARGRASKQAGQAPGPHGRSTGTGAGPGRKRAHAHCTTALPAGCSSAGTRTLTHTGRTAAARAHTACTLPS